MGFLSGIAVELLIFLGTAIAIYLTWEGSGLAAADYYKIGVSILAGIFAVAIAKAFAIQKKEAFSAQLFLVALFLVGVAATKNDVFGLRVFMDRFLVYLQEPLVLLSAFAAARIIAMATENPELGNLKEQVSTAGKLPVKKRFKFVVR